MAFWLEHKRIFFNMLADGNSSKAVNLRNPLIWFKSYNHCNKLVTKSPTKILLSHGTQYFCTYNISGTSFTRRIRFKLVVCFCQIAKMKNSKLRFCQTKTSSKNDSYRNHNVIFRLSHYGHDFAVKCAVMDLICKPCEKLLFYLKSSQLYWEA